MDCNALLGVFQTILKPQAREDVRHWQNEFARRTAEGEARPHARLRVRFTHSGQFYEIHHATAFYPNCSTGAAPRLTRRRARTQRSRATRRARPHSAPRSIRYRTVFVSAARRQLFRVRGLLQRHESGRMGEGRYWPCPPSWGAARAGRDVTGDGRLPSGRRSASSTTSLAASRRSSSARRRCR
jgi:hypothetical protein